MKVKINSVYSPGDIKRERVSFTALKAVEISNYAVMDHTFTQEGDLSDKGRHVYRFPKKEINEGDVIILYSKKGSNSSGVRNGRNVHFFYWGRDTTIWNANNNDTCTLMEVHDSQVVKVNAD